MALSLISSNIASCVLDHKLTVRLRELLHYNSRNVEKFYEKTRLSYKNSLIYK
jgi:hypothetical protein